MINNIFQQNEWTDEAKNNKPRRGSLLQLLNPIILRYNICMLDGSEEGWSSLIGIAQLEQRSQVKKYTETVSSSFNQTD